jgi:cytidylate kinase
MSLITISQDFGSGGSAIAQKVAKDLQLTLYDDERLRKEAIDMGVKSENLKGLEEKTPNFFDRLMGYKPDIYLDVLQSVVYKIARQGTGVIIGHGSQVLLKDFTCAFHVRIFAPQEARVKKLMSLENVDRETAEKIIYKKDEEFRSFFQFAFGKTFNDLSQYDLILNTGKVGIETAASQIVSLSKSEEIIACSLNAMEAMDCMALEYKIKAELLQHNISDRDITLEASKPGNVILRGLASSDDEKEKIESIIRGVQGVNDLESSLVVVPWVNYT